MNTVTGVAALVAPLPPSVTFVTPLTERLNRPASFAGESCLATTTWTGRRAFV